MRESVGFFVHLEHLVLAEVNRDRRPVFLSEISLSARHASQRFVYNHAIMEALKMNPQTDSWNDDRLDELSRRTDESFKEVRQDIKEVRQEMADGFAQVPTREEMNQRFDRLDAKFDAKFDRLNSTLIVAGATIVAAVLANGTFG